MQHARLLNRQQYQPRFTQADLSTEKRKQLVQGQRGSLSQSWLSQGPVFDKNTSAAGLLGEALTEPFQEMDPSHLPQEGEDSSLPCVGCPMPGRSWFARVDFSWMAKYGVNEFKNVKKVSSSTWRGKELISAIQGSTGATGCSFPMLQGRFLHSRARWRCLIKSHDGLRLI